MFNLSCLGLLLFTQLKDGKLLNKFRMFFFYTTFRLDSHKQETLASQYLCRFVDEMEPQTQNIDPLCSVSEALFTPVGVFS